MFVDVDNAAARLRAAGGGTGGPSLRGGGSDQVFLRIEEAMVGGRPPLKPLYTERVYGTPFDSAQGRL